MRTRIDPEFYLPSRTRRVAFLAYCIESNRLIAYYCFRCRAYNELLNHGCHRCSLIRPIELQPVIINHYLNSETERHEVPEDKTLLFARFFTDEKTKVSSMNDEELRLNIEELASFAFEAKARLAANDDEKRERLSKKTKEQKEWQVSSDSNFDTATAVSAVAERKKRQTKGDKMFGDLQKLLGVEGASAILGKITDVSDGKKAVTSFHPGISTSELIQKEITEDSKINTLNSQGELLKDASQLLVDAINNPITTPEQVAKHAVITGHIANRVLGPAELVQTETKIESIPTKPESIPAKPDPFDFSYLFPAK